MKNRISLYSAVGMKCCHIAYHENHEAIFLVCGRQLTQWRGDDGKPLCKTCKRAARKPEASARRSNDALCHHAGSGRGAQGNEPKNL